MTTLPIPPELATQLLDPKDRHLSGGSNTPVMWRCDLDPRHIWSASPNTRRRSPACPVCLNKVIIPGVNDLATTDPELAACLVDQDIARNIHAGSHTKVLWRCGVRPQHQWPAKVVTRTRDKSGCPYCSGRIPEPGVNDLATTHPEIAAQLVDPDLATSVSAGSGKKLLWRCPTDSEHTWSAPVRNRISSPKKKATGCPICAKHAPRASKRHPTLAHIDADILREAVDPKRAAQLSTGSGVVLDWLCPQHPKYTYSMSVRHRMRGQRCPVCAGTTVVEGYNDLATTHPELINQTVEPAMTRTVSKGSTVVLTWKCDHDHTWSAPVYARVAGNGCPTCSPVGSSYGEQDLYRVVTHLYPDAAHRANVLTDSGQKIEVDVLANHLAIEFNGLYWHSEATGQPSSRHADKARSLRKLGYEPITVWEDQWADPVKKTIVLTTLAHRLRRIDQLPAALTAAGLDAYDESLLTQRQGARQLRCSDVSGSEAAAFFRDHHIQGPVALTRAFGLRDDQQRLRAVIGLRSPSHNMRTRRKCGEWEIQRYATHGLIPGGFSRLLTHAERTLLSEGVTLHKWVTFSHDESSGGELYAATGFIRDGSVKPSYWYTGGIARGTRTPKENFQLKRFRDDDALVYEDGWTEREAAAANKLYRVYDSGKTRWVKNVGE